jgi:hypothetical protein
LRTADINSASSVKAAPRGGLPFAGHPPDSFWALAIGKIGIHNCAMRTIPALTVLAASSGICHGNAGAEPVLRDCRLDGIALYGDVQIVDSFPDVRVQIVDSFPDLRVKLVESFPEGCGQWRLVDSFPNFKIQYVDSFPDLKIQVVDSFPGAP